MNLYTIVYRKRENMKHIFIINPTAGKKNSCEVIKEKLNILLQ